MPHRRTARHLGRLARRSQVAGDARGVLDHRGEPAPQRLRTAESLTKVGLSPGEDGRGHVDLTDKRVDEIVGIARNDPDRRFRLEAIAQLAFARLKGSRGQRNKAEKALEELVASPSTETDAAQVK